MRRPAPPEQGGFTPAPEVMEWVEREILSEDGSLYNEAHKHLEYADLRFLWAPTAMRRKGRTVVGLAEQVEFRCNQWQAGRQEQQLLAWFGTVPSFLITLAADYCAECSDVEWCALVEHELFHVAQAINEFGAPVFRKDGMPKIVLVGHEVEEFVGVVERYGVGRPDGDLARLVRAGNEAPRIGPARIAHSCGTCLLRAA